MVVCNKCLEVAYDNGVDDKDLQEEMMIDLGLDLEDHLCDQVETGGQVKCDCRCQSGK